MLRRTAARLLGWVPPEPRSRGGYSGGPPASAAGPPERIPVMVPSMVAEAIHLVEDAFFMQVNGERPPGAPADEPRSETWADWCRRAEQFLRGQVF